MSCFACKIIDGPHNGRCALKDDLSPIFKRIEDEADGIILGTPIYFGSMTGEMRSFIERLLFAPLVYSQPPRSAFPRRIRTGIIYTMNVTEEMSAERGYGAMFSSTEASLRMVFGEAETFCCYDTYQFPDYSRVVMEYMDPAKKAARREEVFPDDCRKAFEFVCRIASRA
jgi:multimeric flavodoxin WrbA